MDTETAVDRAAVEDGEGRAHGFGRPVGGEDRAHLGGGPRRNLITFVEDRPGHDRRYAIDPAKIENELGWRAGESFESGLAKTVHWFLANEDWWRPIREGKYGGSRLGVAG